MQLENTIRSLITIVFITISLHYIIYQLYILSTIKIIIHIDHTHINSHVNHKDYYYFQIVNNNHILMIITYLCIS